MMWRMIFLLVPPGTDTLPAEALTPLPTAAEAAVAFYERERDICRALIDRCESDPLPLPQYVRELSCRPGRSGFARCRFEYVSYRCTAHFVSAAAGAEYVWAREWSNWPAAAEQPWTVAWTRGPDPYGPRIDCRMRD